jgi:hypothetical protein
MVESDGEVDDFLHRASSGRCGLQANSGSMCERDRAEEPMCERDRAEIEAEGPSAGIINSRAHKKLKARSFPDRDESPLSEERQHCTCDDHNYFSVHRPLPFRATSVAFDSAEATYQFVGNCDDGWCARILERYADAGYGPRTDSLGGSDSVFRVFRELPPDLLEVLQEGLHSLQVLSAARAAARAQTGFPMSEYVDPTLSESTRLMSEMEDDMWEANPDCGYLRFEWDPVTERRRFASPSQHLSLIVSLHPSHKTYHPKAATRRKPR